jgi:hypothetical protein
MSEEKSFSGVDALIERMELYPEEFFESQDKRSRWSFMYKDYFRDALTEAEKGRMHEAIRKMRRLEFDATVLKELMKDEAKEMEVEEDYQRPQKSMSALKGTSSITHPEQSGWWNKPQIKREGGKV